LHRFVAARSRAPSSCSLRAAAVAAEVVPTLPPTAPTITAQPAAVTVTEGSAAMFSVTATGTAPLSYQWLRNAVAVPGATATTYTLLPRHWSTTRRPSP
jgi:hypothetical protein